MLNVANAVVKPIRNFNDPFNFAITFDNFNILTVAAAPTKTTNAPANCAIAVEIVRIPFVDAPGTAPRITIAAVNERIVLDNLSKA